MLNRRRLIKVGAAATVAAPAFAAPPGKPLKVLMLGGTNYVGPWLVNTALGRGHEVTLFNRGITNPHFFPELEKLRGDRTSGPDTLAPLKNRKWDIVLDTWQQGPRAVEESAALLRENVAIYAYVSSIAVYGGFRKVGLDENDPRITLRDRDRVQFDYGYVHNKSIAESVVEGIFGPRGLIVRGHSIWGFDYSKKQMAYWPFRMRAGGRVMVPDDQTAVCQYTDITDLCRFILASAENGAGGVYNGTSAPIRFADYIDAVHEATGRRAEVTLIPGRFLVEHGARPFEVVPSWIPADDPEPGFYRISGEKAAKAGFGFRPLSRTIAAQLETFAHKPVDWRPSSGGVPEKLEAQILAAWDAQQD